jgi:hypothetical protein
MQQTHTLIVIQLAASYSEKLSTSLMNRGKYMITLWTLELLIDFSVFSWLKHANLHEKELILARLCVGLNNIWLHGSYEGGIYPGTKLPFDCFKGCADEELL